MVRALKRNRPVLSKCHARIVCFAFPVDHFSESAVIVGRGSFASYRDLRVFLGRSGAEQLFSCLETAPRFTTAAQASRACEIVRSSVGQLLRNEQENAALRQRMSVLQDALGRWDSGPVRDPVTVYDRLVTNLLQLTDARNVQLFFPDRQQGAYVSLYARRRTALEPESLTLDEHDAVVRLLLEQKPYVATTEPVLRTQSDLLQSGEVSWFFPLWINGMLEGIVRLGNGALRDNDIRMIQALCVRAALAIGNDRLQAELNRKFERFTTTVELARALTPILNYEELLQSLVSKSADLLRAERGSLMILDRETDALLLEARKGVIDGVADNLSIPKGQGIAGKVAEMGEPLLVANVENDPRILQKNREHYKTRSFLSVPLKIGDRILGVLNFSDKASGDVFTEDDLQLLQSFAHHAVVVLERNVLYRQTERLKQLSITDALTGLPNRRYLQERLEEELARSSRHGHTLSIMMLDIDGFKPYNDTFGHPAGDRLLKAISDAIMRSIRTTDIAARIGGDEFLVLLPETEASLATHIAERMRAEVIRTGTEHACVQPQGGAAPTISIGIASYPQNGRTSEKIIEQVDQALYQAKMKGRNRIEILN